MKKIALIIMVSLLVLSSCAFGESAIDLLPKPDKDGVTTYEGKVGFILGDDGFVKESLFDESVKKIEQLDGVYKCIIMIQPGLFYDTMKIGITMTGTPTKDQAKAIGEKAIREIGRVFGLTEGYEGPDAKSFGTIFDEFQTLIYVFPRSGGNYIVLGGVASSYAHITW